VYEQYVWQINYHIHGHVWCIYVALANPIYEALTNFKEEVSVQSTTQGQPGFGTIRYQHTKPTLPIRSSFSTGISECVCHLHKANPTSYMYRVSQNRIYTPYMTVYMVISLPKIPYIHRVYGSGQPDTCMDLANLTYGARCRDSQFWYNTSFNCEANPAVCQYLTYKHRLLPAEGDERMGHDAGPASFGTIHHLRS